jgi:hypothetical protein
MARGIPLEALSEHVFVQNLRGQLKDLLGLGAYFAQFEPGRFKVIILDAFYRFLPMKADENDNGTMANLHNYLDAFAERLKCCFVLIHHTSKGNQSQKGVTDVGAGAGSQSRATDTHLILRQHEEDNAVVLDAVVRSWPPVKSLCLRWDFPLWYPAEDLDPEALKGSMRVKRSKPSEDDAQPSWNVASFVDAFLDVQPKSEARIMEDAEGAGLSSRRIGRFLALAEEDALIHRWTVGPKAMKGFATVEQPEDERAETSEERVARLIAENPDLTTREIADECDLSRRRVQQIRRDLVAEPAGNQG